MLQLVAGWFPQRQFVVCADSAYGGQSVLRHLPANVDLISQVHPQGALYGPPPPPTGKRGARRKKGERLPGLQAWARFWVDSVSAVFLKSYLATGGNASWVPQNHDDLELQLTTMLLEKALYELRYELNLRPDWVRIPLRGILDLVAPA